MNFKHILQIFLNDSENIFFIQLNRFTHSQIIKEFRFKQFRLVLVKDKWFQVMLFQAIQFCIDKHSICQTVSLVPLVGLY